MRDEIEVRRAVEFWKKAQTEEKVDQTKVAETSGAMFVQGIVWALEWALGHEVSEIGARLSPDFVPPKVDLTRTFEHDALITPA